MTARHILLVLIATTALSGCLSDVPVAQEISSKFQNLTAPKKNLKQSDGDAEAEESQEEESEILQALIARRSILPSDSTYKSVADAVLAHGASAAGAELRSAKLRAAAENKNWLPTIGPSISLTSLGETLASLVVDQVLFDNGRRKAERRFAAADVEVAAVTLSEDMNERVFTALSLHLTALRGDEKAKMGDAALVRMRRFERIVVGRVEGGVSNKGDQRIVEGRIEGLRSVAKNAAESAASSRSELRALTRQEFIGLYEGEIDVAGNRHVEPLPVLRARAEAKRTIEGAKAERARQLPGLSASANVTGSGTTGSLDVSSEQGLGLGTAARLKAIESTKDTAEQQVAKSRQTAERTQRRLEHRIASLQRQEADAERLAGEGRDTLKLFEAQFKAGQRSVLEVMNVYEQTVQREMDQLDAKFDVIIAQLELARDLGLLADGDEI